MRAAVEAVDGRVVLAAHSYGGVPATWAAAESDQVAELVLLAAFALEPGMSMTQWMGGDFPPAWIHSPDGLAVKAGDAEESIFSGVDPVLAAEAVERLNWQGMRAFTEKKLGAAPAGLPTTYVVATQDPAQATVPKPKGRRCGPRPPAPAPVTSRAGEPRTPRRASGVRTGQATVPVTEPPFLSTR